MASFIQHAYDLQKKGVLEKEKREKERKAALNMGIWLAACRPPWGVS